VEWAEGADAAGLKDSEYRGEEGEQACDARDVADGLAEVE
jgi:hypothetical protein